MDCDEPQVSTPVKKMKDIVDLTSDVMLCDKEFEMEFEDFDQAQSLLLSQPDELLCHISSFVTDLKDLANLRLTCRKFMGIAAKRLDQWVSAHCRSVRIIINYHMLRRDFRFHLDCCPVRVRCFIHSNSARNCTSIQHAAMQNAKSLLEKCLVPWYIDPIHELKFNFPPLQNLPVGIRAMFEQTTLTSVTVTLVHQMYLSC